MTILGRRLYQHLNELKSSNLILNAQDISQHTTTNNELNDLFTSQSFLNFISTILQTRLYPSTDTYGKYYANIFHVGDGLNWHFDRSEYSISLILQPAQEGGGEVSIRTQYKRCCKRLGYNAIRRRRCINRF